MSPGWGARESTPAIRFHEGGSKPPRRRRGRAGVAPMMPCRPSQRRSLWKSEATPWLKASGRGCRRRGGCRGGLRCWRWQFPKKLKHFFRAGQSDFRIAFSAIDSRPIVCLLALIFQLIQGVRNHGICGISFVRFDNTIVPPGPHRCELASIARNNQRTVIGSRDGAASAGIVALGVLAQLLRQRVKRFCLKCHGQLDD